jgi:hypothetical protein
MGENKLPARTAAYQVGYGKPPEQHRFQKGVSGNPSGRPKGTKGKKTEIDTGFGKNAVENFLKLEAYRPITIREGEHVIELPAIQAVFRAMGVSALKGNRFAQKTLAELVGTMEKEHYQSRLELFGAMVDYKHAWDEQMERCRKAGLPEPTPIPHPDDVILNPNTGDVRIAGPQTKEQKALFDKAIERRTNAQADVTYYAKKYRSARDPKKKNFWLEEWHFEQRMFDIVNDGLPERYKIKLENRSYREGASRPGHALDEIRKNSAMRDEHIEKS